jgi:hypothetical protein
MFIKKAATTACIGVKMHHILYSSIAAEGSVAQSCTSNKPVRNKGEISDKLSTASRETETMLSACLNKNFSLRSMESKSTSQPKSIA